MNPHQIIITVTPQGAIKLDATIADPVAILGLLEIGKAEVLRQVQAAANGHKVVAAPAAALRQLEAAG